MSIVDEIRTACARVAAHAQHVHINHDQIEAYARTLPANGAAAPANEPDDQLEQRAAHWLQLNAINFGSGWFPTLRKPAGLSGFRTVEAGLKAHGPWSAAALTTIDVDEVAAALGQDPGHELMILFADHLRELGQCVIAEHDGSFLALARSGDGSAVALTERLARLPGFQDVSSHDGQPVAFFKRAQITASDLHLFGIAPAHDLDRLTLFADNLVPHVLRLDGVLRFDPGLVERIEHEQLIEHGSREEVEIRACALHAVELLVAAHGHTTAATVDNALWDRGAAARYKASPRHRARCTAY
jgi:Potential Queuosine, Q, salvage protein family